MLTSNAMTKILKRMMETYGLDIEEDIQRIRDDFSEREGILKNYGDFPEDSELDEFEFAARETEVIEDNYKQKYDELHQKYIDRFFGGVAPTEQPSEEQVESHEEEQTEDLKGDSEEKTINDLFEKVEG